MEGEIDVGRLLEVIVRRWRLAAAIVLASIVVTAALSSLQPASYRARVLVATIKTTTEVSFDTAIKTLSEEQLKPVSSGKQRMASFAALATSAGIANTVLSEIGDQLPAELRQTHPLMLLVDGTLASQSDLIEIGVTHADPQVAILIANAWGRAYVRHINSVYGDVGDEPLLAIRQEARSAQEIYDSEQVALETTLRQNRTAELERRILQVQSTIESLGEAQHDELRQLLGRLQTVTIQLDAANDLLAQVREGGEPAVATGALAVQVLKVEIYSGRLLTDPEAVERVALLQLDAAGPSTDLVGLIRDLRALASSLSTRREILIQEASGRLAQVAGEDGSEASSTASAIAVDSLPGLEQLLRDLEAELEQESKILHQVLTRRDLARQTSDMLLRKEAELSLASQNIGAEVRLAAPALVATRQGLGLRLNLAIGLVVGAALGVLAVIAAETWVKYRGQAARP